MQTLRLPLVAGLVLLGLSACTEPPRDWHAALRQTAPQYFSPRDGADGWPVPITVEGLMLVECLEPHTSGPHTRPSASELLAVKICIRAKADLVRDEELPTDYGSAHVRRAYTER